MKRVAAFILSLFLMVVFSVNVYAKSMFISFDDSSLKHYVKYFTLIVNDEELSTDVPPVLLSNTPMVPVRAVFEKLGAELAWNGNTGTMVVKYRGHEIKFTSKSRIAYLDGRRILMKMPARLVNQRLVIPLSFFGDGLGLEAEWSDQKNTVSIRVSGNFEIESMGYSIDKGLFTAIIDLTGYENYYTFRLENPDRIVVDFPGVKGPGIQKVMDVNSGSVKTLRYAQFENRLRVVFDVVGQPDYRIEEKSGDILVHIWDDRNPGDKDDDSVDRGGYHRDPPVLEGMLDVMHNINGGKDEVSILLNNYKNYNIMRLSNPDRIVIDIPGARVSTINKAISSKDSLIESIRCAQFTQNIARVVLDVKGLPQYDVKEEKGLLRLFIEKPTYRNVEYKNNGDRVCLILKGAKLTEGASQLKNLYTGSYDPTGLKYTITFPSNLANLASGVIRINDSYIDTIEIKTDGATGKTSITFNAKDKFVYHTITREVVNDTAITILKPAAKNERLVVIDAGHGGAETGAVHGGIYEKDLNLDIAIRVNNLLKEKGVKTYMIREDDSYVGLYERSYIANCLNATLFLSIHNNALGNPDYAGTMTLYLPPAKGARGFTSMRFAEIIQQHLVSTLNSIDRKIIPRPELVVLKATNMHAALAEIGFMTNQNELNKLRTPEYRQKAAVALCNAVLQALEEDD